MKNTLWTPFNRRSPQFSCPIHGQPARTRILLVGGAVLTSAAVLVALVAGRAWAGLALAFWIVGLGAAMAAGYGAIGIAACFPRCTCEVENSEVRRG